MPGILVTGCAGFIGGHILRRLISEGVETVGVDDFSTGLRENIADLEGRFRFVEGTLCDPEVCRRAVEGVTGIIHQAAIPSVPRSIDDPLACLHSSITATATLVSAARDAGVRRLVQAASSAAYGDTEVLPNVETMPPKPLSPYAVGKLAQEYYALAAARCYGLETVSLRYFNVFGPGQNPDSEYAAVIPKFISLMLAGRPPTIYGDGEQCRDFIYIDNVVAANLAALRRPGVFQGEVLNIAQGEAMTLNELVRHLNIVLGTDIRPVYAPARAGDIRRSQADIGLAEKLLGFRAGIDVREGLRRTVEHYRRAF
ncbi:MAG: SDR family oxidoreductase [Candidatus Adiutrix sp.]|jgi:UDP-glucose 4-epimerase|nr:SDR family oxidoreductase [Candidatus Adiutrix sp.]